MHMQNAMLVFFAVFTMTAIVEVSGDRRSQRTKRKVIFVKGSKFFVRLNFKANTLPYTALFAYAAGYKLNFDLPTEAKAKPLRFHRRDIFENMETIFNENGLHGRACMLRFLCEASTYVLPTSGLFHKLVKLIFSIPESQQDSLHPYIPQTECQSMSDLCPMSLFHILGLEATEDT
ncbi:hypothetical protein C0J52_05218 [Blattella germanica]|nr:hypothetical protein C0J52_05218 [Blattella germanica]